MEAQASEVKNTTATKKIFSLSKRIRAVVGGAGASKTFSILIWAIDYGQSRKNKIVSVVSETFPHLERGAIKDFKFIMQACGYWKDERWNETKHTYKFETGTTLEFFSADKLGRARGPRRDVLFLNEANNIGYEVARQLILRTKEVVWLDWNRSEEFWYEEEFEGKRDDIDFLKLTFLDNEALDDGERQEILRLQSNKYLWQVYGLGELGEREGKIFSRWKPIDEIPHEARLERYGLDFGYSNDPTAIVAIYYWNGGYILDELAYQKELSNKQIADILLNLPKALTIADSAEPKSIDELRTFGVNIMPTTKGPGSVLQRIQLTQAQQISYTKRSIHLAKEYRNYKWQQDKDGRIINEPEHLWSHSMDAITYAISSLVPVMRNLETWRGMIRKGEKERPMPGR